MTQLTITRNEDPPEGSQAARAQPTMVIAFDPPLVAKTGEIAEISLREPTAREVREAERELGAEQPWVHMLAYELKLISLVSGLPLASCDLLPIGATNIASAFLQEFVEAGAADEDGDDDEPPEATTIAIDPPLKFSGVSYNEMDLREPLASEIRKARQLLRTNGSLFESRRAQMALVTLVTGLPAPVVDGLPIRTLNDAARVLGRFIGAGRKTGKA